MPMQPTLRQDFEIPDGQAVSVLTDQTKNFEVRRSRRVGYSLKQPDSG